MRRYYRIKLWNFPECGEPGYVSYVIHPLTRGELRRWRKAIKDGCAGEVMAIELPSLAKDGPWRIIRNSKFE